MFLLALQILPFDNNYDDFQRQQATGGQMSKHFVLHRRASDIKERWQKNPRMEKKNHKKMLNIEQRNKIAKKNS